MVLSNPNLLPSDRIAIAGVIDPDAATAGTYTTGWINMADYGSVMAITKVGTLGSSATIDAKLEQDTDGQGSNTKDVTGKAITQLTQAGTDASDNQVVINCRADDLDIANDFQYVRLSVTVGTATSDIDATVLGLDAREQPVTQPAAVAETVE